MWVSSSLPQIHIGQTLGGELGAFGLLLGAGEGTQGVYGCVFILPLLEVTRSSLLGVWAFGCLTLPVNVNPQGGEWRSLSLRGAPGEGGPLLLSTGKLCHWEQNCSLREEAWETRWQGSDTSSCSEALCPVAAGSPFPATAAAFPLAFFTPPLFCPFSVCQAGSKEAGMEGGMKIGKINPPVYIPPRQRPPWPYWIFLFLFLFF